MFLMKKTIFAILITFLFSLITGCDSQMPHSYTRGFYRGYSLKSPYHSQTYDFTDNFIDGVLYNMELESIRDEMDWQNMMQGLYRSFGEFVNVYAIKEDFIQKIESGSEIFLHFSGKTDHEVSSKTNIWELLLDFSHVSNRTSFRCIFILF